MSLRFALISVIALPLLACASSADESSPGASEGALRPEAATVPVYLNHTFGMLTQATIDSVQNNAYLKNEFIDVEVRTTVSPGLTYTGTYLNARETYSELFPDGTFGSTRAWIGVALGDEVTAGLENTANQWKAEFGPDGATPIELRTREVNGVQTPWFRLVSPTWTNTSAFTSLWSMEYVPNAGATAPRTRHEERAARYQPSKLAQNVVAAYFGIVDDERELIRRTLKSVGWKIVPFGQGFAAASPRDGASSRVLFFEPAHADGQGLRALAWQLNRPTQAHTEQLGDAVLQVAPAGLPVATLWFAPPTPAQADRLQNAGQN
jgi:hypothetical protein